MITFLTDKSFFITARQLDWRRLGKQRLEATQILRALEGDEKRRVDIQIDNITISGRSSWSDHPAMMMWKGHEVWLDLYRSIIIEEWIARGYKNTMLFVPSGIIQKRLWGQTKPEWLSHDPLLASHRGNLLRKDFSWYGQFGWTDHPVEGYIWPYRTDGTWRYRDCRKLDAEGNPT